MTRSSFINRCARRIAPLLLAAGLVLAPALTATVRAQDPAAAGEKSEGRPLDGYLATVTLMLLVFFIVGKSARR